MRRKLYIGVPQILHYFFLKKKFEIKVILRVAPNSYSKPDTVYLQRKNTNDGFRFTDDAFGHLNSVINDPLYLFHINNVAQLQFKVKPPFSFTGYVDDHLVKQFSVRNNNSSVIPCQQNRIKKLDRSN